MKISKKDAEMQPTPKEETGVPVNLPLITSDDIKAEVGVVSMKLDQPVSWKEVQHPIAIQVAYLTKEAGPLKQAHEGEWVDVRCASDFNVGRWGHGLMPLGIITQFPDEYDAILAPRSSLFKNFSLIVANSIGVIDNGYRGEWKLSVINFSGVDMVVPAGTRVAQFRLQPKNRQIIIEPRQVSELSETDRGTGGYGSTGTK